MKGILHKTETGWVVRWPKEDPRDPEAALPLHPEYEKYYFLDEDAEGGEVEFDWCVIVDHDSGKGTQYAKLERQKEQTNGERFEEFMNSVQYPELEGTNALCDDIIKKRTGKMTEEEWVAAERGEISDEEIDNYIDKNFIFNDEGNWQKKYFKAGAVWYREQLKKK